MRLLVKRKGMMQLFLQHVQQVKLWRPRMLLVMLLLLHGMLLRAPKPQALPMNVSGSTDAFQNGFVQLYSPKLNAIVVANAYKIPNYELTWFKFQLLETSSSQENISRFIPSLQ
jgi:hypothetical protein